MYEEAKIEKMNEKICQLTRVIYLLHSKNSDSLSTIESIISSYDEEINSIVQDANNALSFLKAKILQLESPELTKATYDLITKQLTSQFQSALASKSNELNEAFKQKEKAMLNDFNDKVNTMKGEVNDVKDQLALYKDKISISQQNEYNKALDDLRKESHKQIETLIVTYEDQLKQREASLKELKKQIEDMNAKDKDNDDKLNKVINEHKDIEEQYKNQIRDLNKEREMCIKDNEKHMRKCNELEKEAKESKAQLRQMELSYESIIIDKAELEKKFNLLITQLNLSKQSLTESKEIYTNELTVNKNLIEDNSNLQKQLASLEEKLRSIEHNNKKQLDILANKLKEAEDKCKKKILTINELKGNHQSEISQLKFTFQTTIDEMKRVKTANDSSSQEVQRLKQLLNDERSLIESKHREELDRISFKHSMSINELKNKFNEDMITLKQDNVKLKERLSNYDKEMKKKQEEFKLNQIEHFQKMKHDFMDALNIQQEKNYNLTNEINDLEQYLANRPSREEDIAEINKLRLELSAMKNGLIGSQIVKGESEGKEEGNGNGNGNMQSVQGKNLKKIKIINSNGNGFSNGSREAPGSGNGIKKISSSTLKNPKYTNANYGMIFSKK